MRMVLPAVLSWALMGLSGAMAADLQLVMVEQPGCVYCRAWDAEVSAIYPRTAEGKLAPLTRIQLRAPLPAGMRFDRPAAFTPTFVLLEDGAEIGRIEGYPGEDFFWGLLTQMMEARNLVTGPD
ncbi:MAG: hypothetical protein RLZZ413_624 [Pseudomonadota bacterium]|jgi:hypothetical protein